MSAHAAVFAEVVRARHSARQFLLKPVPEAQLREIFGLAQQAPSNCNTQPWLVYVASGATRERLREALLADVGQGRLTPDFPFNGDLYFDQYDRRRRDQAAHYFGAIGLARDDAAGRQRWMLRNYEFYDAPHVAFLFMPAAFGGVREAADVGMYAQTLMLALTAHGIASVPETCLGMVAEPVRRVLGIDASQKLLFGIAFGYEDADHPSNRLRVPRAPLEQTTRFFE